MKSLLSKNLDIVDLVINSEIEKIASYVDSCSDKTKTAYIPSYDEQKQHNDNDFAAILYDSKNGYIKKYAMYTPELAELNLNILAEMANELPEELVKVAANNLICTARQYNIAIPDSLEKYASDYFIDRIVPVYNINQKAFFEKTANVNIEHKKYALHGKYPIDTKEEFEKAANWFDRNYNKLSVEEINEFTQNIKTASYQMNGLLEKYANLDKERFNPDFYNHVMIRKSKLKEDDADTDIYDDLLKRADELGAEKVACVLEVIDKEFGLDAYYGKTLVNAYEATFDTIKTAGVNVGHKTITAEMLKKADLKSLATIAGNGVTNELRGPDALAVFESLPTPLKHEIAKIL